MSEQRALAKPPEVARFLGVPHRTLDQWAYLGTGPRWARVGRYRRYRWEDVELWFDERANTTGKVA